MSENSTNRAINTTCVYTDQIEHTALRFSAWLPPIQCTEILESMHSMTVQCALSHRYLQHGASDMDSVTATKQNRLTP